MTIRENVSLRNLTTLRIGGDARFVIDCDTGEDIETAVLEARKLGLPVFILGGGSNVLARDAGYPGVVLRPRIPGVTFSELRSGSVEVTAGAGILWDELVRICVLRCLWGLENLSGIPGTVGGAVVQNIGAYGAALSGTLVRAEAFDTALLASRIYTRDECRFGYRDSFFKHEGRKHVIMRATFTLSSVPAPNFSYRDPNRSYKDVARVLGENPAPTLADIRTAILSIRADKFPDLSKEGTAGSFFENPILPETHARALQARYPEMPLFSMPETSDLKVPLAWLLDHVLGLRGFREKRVRLFEKQALVLVAEDGATAADVEAFADMIAKKVFDATGIVVVREVRAFG
ncbi:MAG: UDP-N-acetylmuramate dehydrogenase [bacterium]